MAVDKKEGPTMKKGRPTKIRDIIEFTKIRETHPDNWQDVPHSAGTRKVKDNGAFLWVRRRYNRKIMHYAIYKGVTYKIDGNMVVINENAKEPPDFYSIIRGD